MSVMTGRAVQLPSGGTIPILGQGTARLAQGRHPPETEIEALRLGIDLGMTLIDTAESYGEGASEELVGRAIEGRRDDVFLVSKVLPTHASRRGTIEACEASLRRLGTDHLDMYLLHWRGDLPLELTIGAFEELKRVGRIRHWGVSNFAISDMADLARAGGVSVEADQVLYNLLHRDIEWNLLPWAVKAGIPLMAYSPLEHGELIGHPVLRGIAVRHKATSSQVALAWVLRHEGVVAIPEAGTPEHVRANRAALDVELAESDIVELDAAFPPPPATPHPGVA